MANEEQREEIEEIGEEVLIISENKKLCEDISSLYCKQKHSDIAFILDGQKIYAHKVILVTRSAYFDFLFCKNKEQSEIILTDISSKVFRKVLKYIYTGSITITSSDVELLLDLLQLANKYVLKSLEAALAKNLLSFINMKNAFALLNQANLYDMVEIRDVCHSFMDENVSEILASDSLNSLTQKSMIKLIERDAFIAREIEIFKSVAKWCKINNDVDSLVLNCVRLSSLNEQEILLVVRPSKLVEDATLLNILTEIAEGKPRTAQRGPLLLKDKNFAISGKKAEVISGTNPVFLLCDGTLKCEPILIKDTNLATPEYRAQVISGTNTSFLLNDRNGANEEDMAKCASHLIGDKSGITVRLGFPSYINHIQMKLWDKNTRCYSYYIETSLDGIKWQKVINYSLYRCRSEQNLYFDQKIIAEYIRIVGIYSTTNHNFVLMFLGVYLKTIVPKVINGIVCPTENVAVKGKGAFLAEGYKALRDLRYLSHAIDKESIIVQLAQPYVVSYMKLQLLNPADPCRYFIETSTNKSDWEIVVDHRNEDCKSWQTLHFKARPALYIKITGTKRSNFETFDCRDLECYYTN